MTDLRKAAEALRLAEILSDGNAMDCLEHSDDAAAELRRLHEENEALRQALAESANSTTDFVESKALAQPEQEPVMFMSGRYVAHPVQHEEYQIPLYTTPPQRTWVGLTDEEIAEYLWMGKDVVSVIKEVQETLRGKNT